MRRILVIAILAFSGPLFSLLGQDLAASKARAYEFYQAKRFADAAREFKSYLDANLNDTAAMIDYGSLLSELKQHDEAVKVFETIHQGAPQNETAYFKLGVEYAALQRYADAEKAFGELERSNNASIAAAAATAAKRARDDQKQLEQLKAEQRIYELAEQFNYDGVIRAVTDLERQGALSFAMQLQRLYAWQSLRQYALTLARADELALAYPNEPDLALLRAELLVQLGRRPEAEVIWREVRRKYSGTQAAVKADRRLADAAALDAAVAEMAQRAQQDQRRAEQLKALQRVYELANQFKHDEVLKAVEELEKQGPAPFGIQMQRLYALQGLRRYPQALAGTAQVAQLYPNEPDVALLRAELLAQLGRLPEAETIWRATKDKFAGTPAAAQADRRLNAAQRVKEDQLRAERLKAEQRIYDLANQFKHDQVIKAVGDLEKEGPVSFAMEMQRLYALQSLRQFGEALSRAEPLQRVHPNEPELALLRGDLHAQLDHRAEAESVWREITQKHAGTSVARDAERRLKSPPIHPAEEHVYELARKRKHREVIAAINEMETKEPLSLKMQLQRLYSMQALGQGKQSLEELDRIAPAHSNSTEVVFLRADLLFQQHRWNEASAILKTLKEESADSKTVLEAERRLAAIPPIANLDKHFWGEAYASGDYFGRFGSIVGSGFVRQGAFIPHARWLQPYAELRFGVDTESGFTPERTIITDNHVGFYGGIRAQLLPTEYLFIYAQAGTDKDLLDGRHGGDWAYDFQAGIYGFKSFGPGTILFRSPPGWEPPKDRPDVFAAETEWEDKNLADLFFWRGDWFIDGGADFSYYHRYASWIGYAQAHEGFRLFQFGPNIAFDAYAVENVSWDIEGNYFDNLVEIGPGARILWIPHRGWEVVLRAEYLNGFYFGRGRDAFAIEPDSHYDEARVGLSVGVKW